MSIPKNVEDSLFEIERLSYLLLAVWYRDWLFVETFWHVVVIGLEGEYNFTWILSLKLIAAMNLKQLN